MKQIELQQWDGARDGWGGNLPIRDDLPPEIEVDATRLRFAAPLFMLRLRAFVEYHQAKGRTVRVLVDPARDATRCMSRMHIGRGTTG